VGRHVESLTRRSWVTLQQEIPEAEEPVARRCVCRKCIVADIHPQDIWARRTALFISARRIPQQYGHILQNPPIPGGPFFAASSVPVPGTERLTMVYRLLTIVNREAPYKKKSPRFFSGFCVVHERLCRFDKHFATRLSSSCIPETAISRLPRGKAPFDLSHLLLYEHNCVHSPDLILPFLSPILLALAPREGIQVPCTHLGMHLSTSSL